RLGITIKARVNSVYRNKLKRQIRESFRNKLGSLDVWDFNVVVPGSVSVDYSTPRKVRIQLEGAWKNESSF
ncbi:MAG: ribonuclease P protein component, partial [Bdellovibrionales bacterium]|nr:ribonuclease P protein component [Bdellovibrionales bacterium]